MFDNKTNFRVVKYNRYLGYYIILGLSLQYILQSGISKGTK